MNLAERQDGDVVSCHMVHEVHGARTTDDELTHVRDVEQPAPLANGFVLGCYTLRVLDRHFPAGEGDDLGTKCQVFLVERSTLERRGSGGSSHGQNMPEWQGGV